MMYVPSPNMGWAGDWVVCNVNTVGAPGQIRPLGCRFQIHRSRSSLRVGCIDCCFCVVIRNFYKPRENHHESLRESVGVSQEADPGLQNCRKSPKIGGK